MLLGRVEAEKNRSVLTCLPRGNGGLDQSDSNKGDEKCQILKIELPGFDDSINVERLKEEPEDTMFFWTCY